MRFMHLCLAGIMFVPLLVIAGNYYQAETTNFTDIFMVPMSVNAITADRVIVQSRIDMRIRNIRSDRRRLQTELDGCPVRLSTGHPQPCVVVIDRAISEDNNSLDKATAAAKAFGFSIPRED